MEMGMLTEAFTTRQLQDAVALLQKMDEQGLLTLAQTIAAVKADIHIRIGEPQTPHPTVQAASQLLCPHCDTPLRRCSATGDIYCSKCRYSRLGGN